MSDPVPAVDPKAPVTGAPVTVPPVDPVDDAVDVSDLDGKTPDEAKAIVKKLRAQVRKMEKDLKRAGITKDEERTLADEVARLRASIDAIVKPASSATPTTSAAVGTDVAVRGFRMTLL